MLIISKPTQFGPDGFAVRGQCQPDSPGWQLRWFERGKPLTVVWRGAFKTCRHLQNECGDAETAEEAGVMVEELLQSNAFTHYSSMPTDIYPAARGDGFPSPETTEERTPGPVSQPRKKRKRKHR